MRQKLYNFRHVIFKAWLGISHLITYIINFNEITVSPHAFKQPVHRSWVAKAEL